MSIGKLDSRVEVIKVTEAKAEILRNLYPIYLHDLSEFNDSIEINEKGLYEFKDLNLYFKNKKLHSFIIKYEGKLAGFILLSEEPYTKTGCQYCIQEFFVLRRYRRKNIGRAAINQLFQKYKGKYCLLILEKNKSALYFWRRVHEYNNLEYKEENTLVENSIRCIYQEFRV